MLMVGYVARDDGPREGTCRASGAKAQGLECPNGTAEAVPFPKTYRPKKHALPKNMAYARVFMNGASRGVAPRVS